jgi:alcohol dehydrogenase class IV
LANAKLGAVHGFAGPMGGMFPAPHGTICARLLPHVMAVNVQALQSRAPNSPALDRYDEAARLLIGDVAAAATDGVRFVHELCEKLSVPPLRNWGLDVASIPDIVAKSRQASSMKGNPIQLTDDELAAILTLELETS